MSMVDKDELCASLEALGVLKGATPVPQSALKEPWARCYGVVDAVEGVVDLDGEPLPLRIGWNQRFPLALALVFLKESPSRSPTPHILWYGLICHTSEEGFTLNWRDPVGLIEAAIRRAMDTLRRVRGPEGADEVAQEIGVLWGYLKGKEDIVSQVSPAKGPKKLFVRVAMPWLYLSDDPPPRGLARLLMGGVEPDTRAVYIPLPQGVRIPAPEGAEVWTLRQVRGLLWESLARNHRRQLKRLLGGSPKGREFVVLGVPRPRGGPVMVGVAFQGARGAHPLLKEGHCQRITPLRIIPADPGYLTERGGGLMSLKDKKVLLAGCGSVGARIAMELARAGVGTLTLVDADKLHLVNIHRHILGRRWAGKHKALALAENLAEHFGEARGHGRNARIERFLEEDGLPPNLDLIVLATGDPTTDLVVNEILRARPGSPPLVTTWLEPYGIGGHALATFPNQRRGCLECVYTPRRDDPDEPQLHFRGAFAAPGQHFAKDLTGCGGEFTPFSTLDASRTAELACRLAIDVLLGRTTTAEMRSWRGPERDFKEAGFIRSARHLNGDAPLVLGPEDILSPGCPCCGTPSP